jgi:hypothetical protein
MLDLWRRNRRHREFKGSKNLKAIYGRYTSSRLMRERVFVSPKIPLLDYTLFSKPLLRNNNNNNSMASPSTTKPPPPEGPKKLQLDDSTRRSSLVTGELADLDAMRDNKKSSIRSASTNCWDDFQYSLKILKNSPRIFIISFIVFAILCGGGLGLVFFLADDQDDDEKAVALDLAVETGRWFGKSRSSIIDHHDTACS